MKNSLLLLICTIIFISCQEQKPNTVNKTKNDSILTIKEEAPISKERRSIILDSINGAEKIIELKKALKKQFVFHKLNGCVLIQQAGIDLVKECYGSTCLKCKKEEKEDITPQTLFQLASVSKTFTAIATLKLVEQKKLTLKDSVQKFYPNFPFHGVTIEQMLSHRSGLPNYIYTFNDSSKVAKRPTNQTIMKWFAEAKPERYGAPGKHFSYNNSNFAVLAAIIEKISKKSYSDFLEQNIFKPLNMNHTYVINSIPDSLSITSGHEKRRKIKKDFNDDVVGDKGIYSSINDLIKWYKCLKKGKLLNEEHMKLAFSPKSFENPGIRNYGYGFRMILDKESQKPKYIYHNGWWKGYSTLFWFDPKTESFITILSNERNKAIYKTSKLIDILDSTSMSDNSEK